MSFGSLALTSTVKDANGRIAVDVASKPMKAIIQAALHWHGRYHDTEPLHNSATCFVFKAIDEHTIDSETGLPRYDCTMLESQNHRYTRIHIIPPTELSHLPQQTDKLIHPLLIHPPTQLSHTHSHTLSHIYHHILSHHPHHPHSSSFTHLLPPSRKVALKLMRLKSHYLRELSARDKQFSSDFVVNVLHTHMSASTSMGRNGNEGVSKVSMVQGGEGGEGVDEKGNGGEGGEGVVVAAVVDDDEETVEEVGIDVEADATGRSTHVI